MSKTAETTKEDTPRTVTRTITEAYVDLTLDRRMTVEKQTCPACGYDKTVAECVGERDQAGLHQAQLKCPDCGHEWYMPTMPDMRAQR